MFKVREFETRTLNWWYQERDGIDMTPSTNDEEVSGHQKTNRS